jgi:hypothetical protein
MNEWIECNLPWQVRLEWPEMPSAPDMDAQIKNQFGVTEAELEAQFFPGDYGCTSEHPLFLEFREVREQLENEFPEEEVKQKLQLHPSVAVQTVLAFRGIRKSINEWAEAQPEWLAWVQEHDKAHETHKKAEGVLSFCGQDLNRAGTVIEFEDEGKLCQMMIGTINELGGSCDDCRGISNETIILRYKVLWNGQDS